MMGEGHTPSCHVGNPAQAPNHPILQGALAGVGGDVAVWITADWGWLHLWVVLAMADFRCLLTQCWSGGDE